MRKVYRHKRETLLGNVQHILGNRVRISGAASGLHAILHVSHTLQQEALVHLAAEARVRLHPVSDYHVRMIHTMARPWNRLLPSCWATLVSRTIRSQKESADWQTSGSLRLSDWSTV